MFNNKGSSLIIVLIIMSFVMVLATSTVKVTNSEEKMSKSFNNSNSAYYICEAGIERAINIIKTGLNQSNINSNLSSNETLETDQSLAAVKSVIDSIVSDYFTNSFNINSYQNYISGSDGKSGSNGIDTKEFSDKYNMPTYYNISLNTSKASTIDSNTNLYEKIITINSTGYSENSIKKITADYKISFIVNIQSSETEIITAGYPDLSIYCNSAISLIGDPQNNTVNTFNGFLSVDGNALLTGKSVNTNGTVTINNGTLAIRGDNINFSGSTNINGDFISDVQNPSVSGGFDITNGSLYSPVNINNISRYNISQYNDSQYNNSWGNKLLINDKSHIGSFVLKPIIDTADFSKNDRGVKYFHHPEVNPDISKDKFNGTYDVLICENDLTISESFDFNGLIYCTGTITFTANSKINGIIIAKNINMHRNTLNVNYGIPNEDTGKIDDIIQTITKNTQSSSYSSSESSSVSISGYSMSPVNWKEN